MGDADESLDPSTDNDSENAQEYTTRELESLFDYTPPSLTRNPEWDSEEPTSPFWFYDKHIDEPLQLLHVKPLPTLLDDIAAIVDSAMEEHGTVLPPLNHESVFIPADSRVHYARDQCTEMTDDRSVARFYHDTTSLYCEPVASMLGVHPHAAEWMPSLMWNRERDPESQPPGFSAEGYTLRVRYDWDDHNLKVLPELRQCLDDALAEELGDVARRFPELSTWQICVVSDQIEGIFRDMDRIAASGRFHSKTCGTRGHMPRTSVRAPTPDARSSPWKIPEFSSGTVHPAGLTPKLPLRRSTRFQKEAEQETPQGSGAVSAKARPFEVFPGVEIDYTSHTAEDLLQHAWTRSVRSDATIIVFYCGNFERVGIRHRKTQTLYLSRLIDIAGDRDPPHGKLHIGLYIAAFQDARDRAAQLREAELLNTAAPSFASSLPPKRRVEDEGSTTRAKNSRRKVSHSDQEPDIAAKQDEKDKLYHEAGLRDLVLVHIQYDNFNSVSPGSFLRIGRSLSSATGKMHSWRARRKYFEHEYFTLVISSTIAQGATGVLHEAELVLKTKEGITLRCKVVIKLAFSAEQQDRMRHEYSIYEHLVSAGIKGVIVDVLGLFKDLEGGPMALIMSHAGSSLWDRRPDKDEVIVRASCPAERTAFLQAIQSIHDADVRHNDLSPGNLLVDDAGQVTIIDFDRATFLPSKGAKKRELTKMTEALDGRYAPREFVSPPTTATSGSRSDLGDLTPTPTVGDLSSSTTK